ncbi:hypothetical protein KCMC57_65160 (plasmid) [Kitasatospora sp. CMC57]|uniref:Uncharacterized protein n=1 Tax=Kitasatospora sp. CMC57 TaxID=3231513 RepID=A0AB33KE81_9ACTN
MTIQQRLDQAQHAADQAAQNYANIPDGPDKDYAGQVWSRAVDDLKDLKANAIPA